MTQETPTHATTRTMLHLYCSGTFDCTLFGHITSIDTPCFVALPELYLDTSDEFLALYLQPGLNVVVDLFRHELRGCHGASREHFIQIL